MNDLDLQDLLIQSHNQALFLNVDDPEKMVWIWHSADELYFNIADSPGSSSWGVRDFLLPFQNLLRQAGVQEVRAPTVPSLPVRPAEARLSLVCTGFDDMRRGGHLIDVKFVTDDGKEFPAHRVVLATMCDHFRIEFCGSIAESGPITSDQMKVVLVPDYPSHCLEMIIGDYLDSFNNRVRLIKATEYLYTEVIPSSDDPNNLLSILHLAHQWDISSLHEAMQVCLIPHIALDTYKHCES